MKQSDLEKYLPEEFETLEQARDENDNRIRRLRRTKRTDCLRLAEKLENCTRRRPCESGACFVCCRRFRLKWIPELWRLYRRFPSWRMVTLLLYEDVLTDKELRALGKAGVKRLMRKLRTRLRRAEFLDGVIIGNFEIDFQKDIRLWMPHFHLLMPYDRKRFRLLRNLMKKHCNMKLRRKTRRRPMHKRKIKNSKKQLSYCVKFMCQRREAFRHKNGDPGSKKGQLSVKHSAMSLLLLDEVGCAGLMFLLGVCNKGKPFSPKLKILSSSKSTKRPVNG